jgi:hypothetical protein
MIRTVSVSGRVQDRTSMTIGCLTLVSESELIVIAVSYTDSYTVGSDHSRKLDPWRTNPISQMLISTMPSSSRAGQTGQVSA